MQNDIQRTFNTFRGKYPNVYYHELSLTPSTHSPLLSNPSTYPFHTNSGGIYCDRARGLWVRKGVWRDDGGLNVCIDAYQSSFLHIPPLSSLLLPPPSLHTFTSPPLLYLATYSILLQTPNIWTPNTGFKRPNCALDKRTILCLYFPAGFQRQVFKHVKI